MLRVMMLLCLILKTLTVLLFVFIYNLYTIFYSETIKQILEI